MSFATPAGLWALLALPAILALHMFRRRHRERRVSGLFLFAATSLRADAGPVRTRLLRSASLWLELAAALAIALWLGGLSLGDSTAREHVVIVLDDSASMGATVGGASTADRVRDAVLDELAEGRIVTIVRTGPRPTLLAGPRVRAPLAHAPLEAWTPRRPAHDPAAALALGLQLGGDATRFLYFTDQPTDEAPPEYEVRALGRFVANAAIVDARRVPEPDGKRESLYLELRAWGEARDTELIVEAVSADGTRERVLGRAVTLTPGSTLPLALERLPRSAGPLVVSLQPDGLTIDDAVTLLAPPDRTVSLWAGGLSDELRRALSIDRALDALPGVRESVGAGGATLHLTETPGDLLPGRVELVIAPSGDAIENWVGPFVVERRHRLLEGVALDGVYWASGNGTLPGRPLVLAAGRALVTEEAEEGALRLRLDLDPRSGNLARAPDWPILLANVVEVARTLQAGPREVNVRLGDVIAYRPSGTSEDHDRLVLFDPSGARHPARGLRLLTWDADQPGSYRLLDGESERARFSVNFVDELESDLTACASATRSAITVAAGDEAVATAGGAWEGRALALVLLALLVADWLMVGGGLRRRSAS